MPAEGAGAQSFSNIVLGVILFIVPYYLKYKIGGGSKTFVFFALLTTVPILVGYWALLSLISPRINEKAKLPGKPISNYLRFRNPEDEAKYKAKGKIPVEVFYEMYFNSEVDMKGDMLDVLEYRHDWATFNFTVGVFRHFLLGFLPEMLIHSRSQGNSRTPKLACKTLTLE